MSTCFVESFRGGACGSHHDAVTGVDEGYLDVAGHDVIDLDAVVERRMRFDQHLVDTVALQETLEAAGTWS